jgi:hypothetical protein
MRAKYLCLLMCFLPVGCASAPSIPRIQYPRVDKSDVVVVNDLPSGAVLIGGVRGLSCQNGPLAPLPTQDVALDKMKQQAADLGATGILNARYVNTGLDVGLGCWNGIYGTGVAYHVDK